MQPWRRAEMSCPGFKKRGGTPSRVIAEQALVPVNAEREAFIETRAQEVDLPVRFSVVYQDLERDADIGTQYAKRVAGPSSAMHSRNEMTFDLPLTLTAAEATHACPVRHLFLFIGADPQRRVALGPRRGGCQGVRRHRLRLPERRARGRPSRPAARD
jgi:hypothetical protein